jgi:DNA primase
MDAAALWSAGLRNAIPVYGVTGLTEEIKAHLVECRVRRVVLLLDTDDAGCAAASDMAQRLAAMSIEARSVELPVKDAAEFIAGGGTAENVRRLMATPATSKPNAPVQVKRATTAQCCFQWTNVSIECVACRRWDWSGSG